MSPRLDNERWGRTVDAVLPTAIALLAAGAVGSLLVLAAGESPATVWWTLLRGTWGNAYGIGEVIAKTTPLVFTGLAVAIAYEARLFNIGAEGQLTLGGFVAALVGAHLGAWPATFALVACGLLAAASGAAAGGVAGVLRATTGAHEVITTIMLNAVIAGVLLWLGGRGLFVPEQLHTRPIAASAALRRLGDFLPVLHGSKASTAILVALAAALGYHLLVERTVLGLHLRAVGLGRDAAEAAGVPVWGVIAGSMALSGALAGLGGFAMVCGTERYYENGFAGGVGFLGIAVALLGRGRAGGIVLAALLFGTVSEGGFAISALVPRDVVLVLQAVIILAVAASAFAARRLRDEPAAIAAPGEESA